MVNNLAPKDYWQAIILFGLNTATYKIALGQCLLNYVLLGKTDISFQDLAKDFFLLYNERLKTNKPQIVLPNRFTTMERVNNQYTLGKLSFEDAIFRVSNEAFGDVIPRFHTVDNEEVPTKFYTYSKDQFTITDEAYRVLCSDDKDRYQSDLLSRWDLLEAAFTVRRENYSFQNDRYRFYLEKGNLERQNITQLIPVLNGYQKGNCFYCGQKMQTQDIHVDHVIPWAILHHDEVWNLVLAHSFCNEQKSDLPPTIDFTEQLIYRNEALIKSNHPLKQKLILQTGLTKNKRRDHILTIYNDIVWNIFRGLTWTGVRGYNPKTDPIYHAFVNK